MPVASAPLVAFDPHGMVFVIALDSRFIRMYDCRNYEKGPFGSFEIVDDTAKIIANLPLGHPSNSVLMGRTCSSILWREKYCCLMDLIAT